ncbi:MULTISPECIES: hypothetical protein [unclassified Microbacterium]|uniref:hypothetical protein n=1 Tax=unclassified Microbacterium TaxID=2609290 RepID=UPI0038654A31
MKTWQCGDCSARYPTTVDYCQRPFDDYLALHGGSMDAAVQRAVAKAIAPLVRSAERRLYAGRTHPAFPLAA